MVNIFQVPGQTQKTEQTNFFQGNPLDSQIDRKEIIDQAKRKSFRKLAHLPQFAVENGQNIVGGWQKPLGYQPPFLENQM
jgi:hypothetical protein